MKTVRTNLFQESLSAVTVDMPFVGQNVPYVGSHHHRILPLICKNRPFIVFRRNSGFSMIELMITLVLIGIVAGLVIPNFRSVIQNNRLTTQANTLLIDLNFARSEAIKRSSQMGFCRSTDGVVCSGGGNWENGWLTFVDVDNSGSWTGGTDQPLRFQEALAGGNTLRANATGITDPIILSSRGTSNTLPGAVFQLCDDRGAGIGKSILISRVGQIRVDGNPPAACT
jgi:type IV fimbrial biogenesis protein FimT